MKWVCALIASVFWAVATVILAILGAVVVGVAWVVLTISEMLGL